MLEQERFTQFALTPGGTDDVSELVPKGRQAIYLGTEGAGLPAALMARMQTVRINMADDFDSLNVAAASAVALHRLWRRR
jgi:tRNA G18 (ribose-2'-O)-methylase SpoU